MAFCDVDENKIKQGAYVYEESKVKVRNALQLASYYVILLYHVDPS